MNVFLNNKPPQNKGFTLIELMVVISIIAMLSSVTLASLNSSRIKANDAKVKTQLLSVRNALATAFTGSDINAGGTAHDCGTLVTANPSLGTLLDNASWPDSAAPFCYSDAAANSKINAYAVWHAMPSSADMVFCTDSTGKTAYITGATTNPNLIFNSNCLEWSDTNARANWYTAVSTCASWKTGGRLPTIDELKKRTSEANDYNPTTIYYWSSEDHIASTFSAKEFRPSSNSLASKNKTTGTETYRCVR
jgi:prepilin-type N-terminal cleavage/methylation domain-containing protein